MEELTNSLKDLMKKNEIQNNKIKELEKQIEELNITIDNFVNKSDTNSQNLIALKDEPPNQYNYVAKLNNKKTKILNIYIDRKTASLCNGYQKSSLDEIVKQNKLFRDHYYILYNDCDIDIKNNFSYENGFPILYKNGIGKYHLDGYCIEEFVSRTHCCTKLKMCDKTLSKLLKNNTAYKESTFKILQDKIQMIQE